MLDLLGAIVGMMAIGINLVAITSVLPGPLAQRLSLAAQQQGVSADPSRILPAGETSSPARSQFRSH
jgi:hypothetical protein